MEIPKEVAILPLEEKEKYIIELRKQGKTYREIAKILKVSPVDISRVLRGVVKKDEITELKEKVEELENAFWDFYDFAIIHGEINRNACVFYEGGYCKFWKWERDDDLDMKEERINGEVVYRLSVEKHVEACVFCPVPIFQSLSENV